MDRKITKKIKLGNMYVGGDSVISVQSMTNTDTRDVDATVNQILNLEKAGCNIVRCAVPNIAAAEALKDIIKPDIHFDYKLALKSIESGANALRINPGNIGSLVEPSLHLLMLRWGILFYKEVYFIFRPNKLGSLIPFGVSKYALYCKYFYSQLTFKLFLFLLDLGTHY